MQKCTQQVLPGRKGEGQRYTQKALTEGQIPTGITVQKSFPYTNYDTGMSDTEALLGIQSLRHVTRGVHFQGESKSILLHVKCWLILPPGTITNQEEDSKERVQKA